MPEYLVERYDIGVSAADAEAAAARLSAAASVMRAAGADVELLGSRFVPGDESSFTVFAASSAEVVEAAHRQARVPFERIVETIPLGGPDAA